MFQVSLRFLDVSKALVDSISLSPKVTETLTVKVDMIVTSG